LTSESEAGNSYSEKNDLSKNDKTLAGQIIGVSLPKDSIGKVLSDDGL
jgi:hypothetical protein